MKCPSFRNTRYLSVFTVLLQRKRLEYSVLPYPINARGWNSVPPYSKLPSQKIACQTTSSTAGVFLWESVLNACCLVFLGLRFLCVIAFNYVLHIVFVNRVGLKCFYLNVPPIEASVFYWHLKKYSYIELVFYLNLKTQAYSVRHETCGDMPSNPPDKSSPVILSRKFFVPPSLKLWIYHCVRN